MRYFFFIICISIFNTAFSQQKFIQSGKIRYERKLGQFTLMESLYPQVDQAHQEDQNMFIEELKKVLPRIVTDSYVLNFNSATSIYKFENENSENKYFNSSLKPNEDAYLIQSFTDSMLIMRTAVFENKYLIQDSLTKYQWKITGELRKIAGFDCKKAITKIADSIVVVAFYTDEIIVKGGPESFNGLPGMIMGIAIPRISLTLFATKIELNNTGLPLRIPIERKPNYTHRKDVLTEIEKGIKQWGKEANIVKWILSM